MKLRDFTKNAVTSYIDWRRMASNYGKLYFHFVSFCFGSDAQSFCRAMIIIRWSCSKRKRWKKTCSEIARFYYFCRFSFYFGVFLKEKTRLHRLHISAECIMSTICAVCSFVLHLHPKRMKKKTSSQRHQLGWAQNSKKNIYIVCYSASGSAREPLSSLIARMFYANLHRHSVAAQA